MIDAALTTVSRYRIRIMFFVVAGLAVALWLRGRPLRLLGGGEDALGLLGAALALLGALLRSWAAGIVHKNEALAAVGPYSLTRHPLYAGSFLLTVGFAIVAGDPLALWVLVPVFALLYAPRIRAEEQLIRATFGERWRAYAARTGLFYPRTLRPHLGAPWDVRRWLANREYLALVTALAGLGLVDWIARLQRG